MALIYTDEDLIEQGYLYGASMDWQEEADENSFSLEMGLEDYGKLENGCYVYDEKYPQFGGRIQKIRIQTANNNMTWEGPTFAGILATKIIEPGTDPETGLPRAYREITGTLSEKVNTVLELVGLDGVFYTGETETDTGTWTIDRYTDVLTAFRKLAEQNNLTLLVTFDKSEQKLRIGFATIKQVTVGNDNEYDSDVVSFSIEKDMNPVNHLICLGSGQLTDRMVYHLYRTDLGFITDVRPSEWSVADEVVATYDYSNVESYEELQKAGKKRFQELLDEGTKLDITPPEETIFNIGDIIAGREQVSGIYVEKAVRKIIYKAQEDIQPTINYETMNTKKG